MTDEIIENNIQNRDRPGHVFLPRPGPGRGAGDRGFSI